MARSTLLFAALLVLPAFAGCLGGDDAPAPAAEAVAASAAEAGAVSGPAPAAAKAPYQMAPDASSDAIVTAYPVAIETNPAKAPYVEEFTGAFQAHNCLPTGGGLPLGGLGLARGGQFFDVTEVFAQNDVFSYDVTLTWTNTDQSWAELHLWNQFDDVRAYWNEPTSDGRGEVSINLSGQGFIVAEEFFAAVGVDCWYGSVSQPIPFAVSVSITFAEGSVPSQVPVLLDVPEGATRLFVRGVALVADEPVLSHYRVFAPDDSLVCECALSSDETADVLTLPEAGRYVVLVDHTSNGFVSLALDAPPLALLQPLGNEWVAYPLIASAGSAVDETIAVDLPSTPLAMWAWAFAPGPMSGTSDVGGGHNLKIGVSNARGEVLRTSMVGYFTYHAAAPGMFRTNQWMAIPIEGDWEFYLDHHAYDLGAHQVHVTADQLRGEVLLFAQHYVRPA